MAAIAVLALAVIAKADVSLGDAFASLYSMMGATNLSQAAFIEDATDGSGDWYPVFLSARTNISEQAMRTWFCSLAGASVPTNASYSEKNVLLRSKAFAICQIATNEAAVCGDTNCWMAVADECGRKRDGLYSKEALDALRGVVSRNVDNNGMEYISITDISGIAVRQRFAAAEEIERCDMLLKDFVSDVKVAFSSFLASDTAVSLATHDRNSLVSNIVLVAHFTPDEAASLGLTNIVEQVSN
jgi:hypothetical protein